MPTSTIEATPGSAVANSYATLAEAMQFHLDRPAAGTTWAAATDDAKTKGLLWAAKLLDAMWVWTGYKTSKAQRMQWPRVGMYDRGGYIIEANVIPEELKWAQSEFARQLMAEDRAADNDIENLKITSLTAGPVSLTFGGEVHIKIVPDAVMFMLPQHWGYIRRQAGVSRLIRA